MNTITHVPPFRSIKDTCALTGLSQFYIRTGVRNGTIEHVRCGQKYLVNVPALLRKLNVIPKTDDSNPEA